MAITSKPQPKSPTDSSPIDDEALKQLINKGGTPPPKEPLIQSQAENNELKKVQLRLPQEVLDSIDAALAKRNALVRPSRHTWLLEAIAEKLGREEEK